jgi:ketosteroid isomerase-like protein
VNRSLVDAAFERWRDGTGNPFDLLADDAQWTIVGSSPLAKTYRGRDRLLDELIRPFNARLAAPLRPDVRALHVDGDTVIVRFDAEATASDGSLYRNWYCWCMRFADHRVTEVVAYLDTRLLDEFWARVAPVARE